MRQRRRTYSTWKRTWLESNQDEISNAEKFIRCPRQGRHAAADAAIDSLVAAKARWLLVSEVVAGRFDSCWPQGLGVRFGFGGWWRQRRLGCQWDLMMAAWSLSWTLPRRGRVRSLPRKRRSLLPFASSVRGRMRSNIFWSVWKSPQIFPSLWISLLRLSLCLSRHRYLPHRHPRRRRENGNIGGRDQERDSKKE